MAEGDISGSANRIIDSVRTAEQSALEAVRKFVDTVDNAIPEVGQEGARRKIIDSAFKMTEQLLGATNQLAERVVTTSSEALGRRGEGESAS